MLFFFFFKQKTAYEILVCDWSSDVCSSDLFGASGIQLTGSCTGCTPGGSPTASGTAHGAFVGDAAQKMITSFGLTSAGKAISGTALLDKK